MLATLALLLVQVPPVADPVTPLLAASLRNGGAEVLRVGAWFELEPGVDPREVLALTRAVTGDLTLARQAAWDTARARVAPVLDRATAWLAARGVEVERPSELAPVLFFDLEVARLPELARTPGLLALYPSIEYEPEDNFVEGGAAAGTGLEWNDDASPTSRFDAVHRRGITGAGSVPAIIEADGATTSNPYLPSVVRKSGSGTGSHPTAIAGIIASSHTTYYGGAPGVSRILSANANSWSDSALIAAGDWAIQNGADILSCSFGFDTNLQIATLDRYFDYVIRNFGVLMTKSCGNNGANGNCTSPCLGYNMIATGNNEDGDNSSWRDDVMRWSSSTRNPAGREKPEICAAGTNITSTTTSSPWVGSVGTGTSYAGPKITALGCLLFEEDPALKSAPEALKAIAMASAWHNIEGAALVSDRDGAGAMDAGAAHRVVKAPRYLAGLATAAQVTGGNSIDFTVWLNRNDHTRAVLCWDSHANASYTTDQLLANFTLEAYDPQGTLVASSSLPQSSFEILEFTPATSGSYRFAVTAASYGATSTEPFGLAVSVNSDTNTSQVTALSPLRIGQTSSLRYQDWYEPGLDYAIRASFGTLPALIPIDTRMVPLARDIVFQESADPTSPYFSGFAGTLNGSGVTTAPAVHVPAAPAYVGRQVYLVGFTLHPSAPSGVVHIGEVLTETIQP